MNMEKHSAYKHLTRIVLRVLLAFLISHSSFLIPTYAQTFTQRIQKQTAGQGTVTIHQNAAIDSLVNSAALTAKPAKPATTQQAHGSQSSTQVQQPTQKKPQAQQPDHELGDQQDTPVDTGKKMIRGGYKVNGYRVQAFAGGNSRKDRQQAERIGNDIKSHYANVPVYVHFYSPRWICRVGNYRTYEEAHQMLVSLRQMGYTQATIVKGKITVAY